MRIKQLFVISFSLFIVGMILLEVCTLNKSRYSDDGSMNYEDSLRVSELEKTYSFDLLSCSNELEIRNGFLAMKNSTNYNEGSIDQYIVGLRQHDTIKVQLKLRSWIQGRFKLIEKEPFKGGYVYLHGKRLVDVVKRNLRLMKYEFPLYSNNDYSVIAKDGKLFKMNKGLDTLVEICENFQLQDPIYNKMVVYETICFIRTGRDIYLSKDNMRTWRIIYSGKRQVSDEMFFRSSDSTLVFAEYTPGNTLERHHVITYNVSNSSMDTTMLFYSTHEHMKYGLEPSCRHIHVMQVDPYSGDVYLGVGDSNHESAIYRSTDFGRTFVKFGGGSQKWRTLTFIFDKNRVYWTMDSNSPQYICGIDRDSIIPSKVLSDDDLQCYPLINSALWNSLKINENFYLISCNSEGAIYDDYHYIYGVELAPKLRVYNLISEKSIYFPWHQFFLLGVDCNNEIWTYDTGYRRVRKFKLLKE